MIELHRRHIGEKMTPEGLKRHRAGRNPAGLPEANLAPAQRRKAAASAAPVETEGPGAPVEGEGAIDETSA